MKRQITPNTYPRTATFAKSVSLPNTLLEANPRFVSCEELFPEWHSARSLLTQFCNGTGDWIVDREESELRTHPDYPLIKDEISQEMVPLASFFPPEDVPKIDAVLEMLGEVYLPDLSAHLREPITDRVVLTILYEIKEREHHIISIGGRSFKDEMRFKLGIAPY